MSKIKRITKMRMRFEGSSPSSSLAVTFVPLSANACGVAVDEVVLVSDTVKNATVTAPGSFSFVVVSNDCGREGVVRMDGGERSVEAVVAANPADGVVRLDSTGRVGGSGGRCGLEG